MKKYYVMKDGKAVREASSLEDIQGEDEGKVWEIDEPDNAGEDGDLNDLRLLVIHDNQLKRLFKHKDDSKMPKSSGTTNA